MVDNTAGGTMGEKTTEETMELYEMLGANSQQNSARGRRGVDNKVQVNNGMATQLTDHPSQVALLNSQTQPSNEVYGLGGIFGHRANMCPHKVYKLEQINYMNTNWTRQHFDPYANTFNPGWRSHPNLSWRNN